MDRSMRWTSGQGSQINAGRVLLAICMDSRKWISNGWRLLPRQNGDLSRRLTIIRAIRAPIRVSFSSFFILAALAASRPYALLMRSKLPDWQA
jgi:hypothetical protein